MYQRNLGKHFLDIRKGDILGVVRHGALGLYEHYAVYIGDGMVVHYAGEEEDFSGKIEIKKAGLNDFLKKDDDYFVLDFDVKKQTIRKVYAQPRFHLLDDGECYLSRFENFTVYSPAQTVERALSRVGEQRYNLVFNNCEHFAIWCKTGMAKSLQVRRVVETVLYQGMRGLFWRGGGVI